MNDVVYYRYLAKTTSPMISIPSTYIVFLTKLQKGKPSEMDLPFLKVDITTFETTVKILDK
jgi:hypothetical protein